MKKVVGVKFKPAGKIYDFDSNSLKLNIGEKVIVETGQGLGFGTIATHAVLRDEKQIKKPLKPVNRIATEADLMKVGNNIEEEKNACEYCQDCIKKLDLKMKLFTVECNFDGNKLTFFFTSDERVDFRQLVKMLVKRFKTRIELRQIGIRNQAKMIGGIGRCGRKICCSSFLDRFEPVSIKMAKEQKLSLNPTKISGLCGRLMCCLTFECDTYRCPKNKYPKIGSIIKTAGGTGKVIRHNITNNEITILLENNVELQTSLSEIIEEEVE